MWVRRHVVLCLVAGCGTAVEDSGGRVLGGGFEAPPPREPGSSDTGTAFVMWHGSVAYNPSSESFSASRGYGAMTLDDSQYVCDIEAQYSGTGIGPQGCPECEWSFSVRVTGGATSGSRCDDFIGPTAFDNTEYWDFPFGSTLNGFGWTEAYVYTYGTTDYPLENVIWAHIDGAGYRGWYFYGYDIPTMGVVGVTGDKYAADFRRYATTGGNAKMYYYFYY